MWIGLHNNPQNMSQLIWLDGTTNIFYISEFLRLIHLTFDTPPMFCIALLSIYYSPILFYSEKENCATKRHFLCETTG